MSKCNSLFQDEQEALARERYQHYLEECLAGFHENTMSFEEWCVEECYESDYAMGTKE